MSKVNIVTVASMSEKERVLLYVDKIRKKWATIVLRHGLVVALHKNFLEDAVLAFCDSMEEAEAAAAQGWPDYVRGEMQPS